MRLRAVFVALFCGLLAFAPAGAQTARKLLMFGGGTPAWAAPGSLFGLDFANSRYWPAPLASQTTFSRASVGEADNLSGVWSQFASGVARINNKGLRYEPGRTDSARNNSNAGAATGTPGTNPTDVAYTTAPNGLSKQTVGFGLDAFNKNYIDIRWFGTATAAQTTFASFEMSTTQIAALNGQAWANSAWMSVVGGSQANIGSFLLRTSMRDAAGTALAALDLPVTLTGTDTRFVNIATLNNASTAFIQPQLLATTVAGAVDITIRFAWAQPELGASATSPIITSGSAVARLADVLALIRTDIGRIVFTFSDGTTQTVSGITKGSPYTVPTTLNEQVIARMDGYAQ